MQSHPVALSHESAEAVTVLYGAIRTVDNALFDMTPQSAHAAEESAAPQQENQAEVMATPPMPVLRSCLYGIL